jgi:flagellar basal body P-ring protein FlgI
VQVNQLAAGRIAGGAIVERAVPNAVAQMNGVLQLQLNDMDYGTAQRIVSAVNSSFGPAPRRRSTAARSSSRRRPTRRSRSRSWRACRTST